MSWLPRTVRVALLAALPLLAACAGAEPPDSGAAPDRVRVYLSKAPASLSLLGKADTNTEIVAFQITDSLVQYDAELELAPRVAESWRFSDDRLTLTFRLRDGIRWHDGEALTADDVVFTVDKVREPAVENRVWAPMFRDLVELSAPDARTVVARYEVAAPEALEAWRVPLLPRHLAGRDADLVTGEFSRHPVGCGPFRFVRYETDREIVLEANDDYWDGRPAIDQLVFRIFPDQRTAYQALFTGELDFMHMSADLWQEARDSPRAEHLRSGIYHALSVWHIGWNARGNPFFGDPRVRRAMVHALDRDRFNESVLYGLARPGVTPFHPDTPWADPDLEPLRYDPDEARRLLDAAGWIDTDGDGVRDRDGRPFEFTLMIPASTQKVVDHLAAWQQESWSDIGVRAEIEKLEWQAFRQRRAEGRFDAAEASFQYTPNPDQFYDLYHSAARDAGFNFFGLEDPEIDRLLEQGRRSFDPAIKRETYFELQRRLRELEPLTCLFHFATPVLYDRRLEEVRFNALGYGRTTDGPRLWRRAEGSGGT
jgi:peptide/nickel transport system substrate-binding protein